MPDPADAPDLPGLVAAARQVLELGRRVVGLLPLRPGLPLHDLPAALAAWIPAVAARQVALVEPRRDDAPGDPIERRPGPGGCDRLTVRVEGTPAARAKALGRAAALAAVQGFDLVLVDLGGLAPADLSLFEVLDAVVLLAPARRTPHWRLTKVAAEIPPALQAGVLLFE